jgi:vacuolar protein sorting-associated protein 13A/C
VDTGEWCDRFSLDVAGSSGVVTCRANDLVYQIGVHNTLTHNSLTKQIVFMPYYALINRAPFMIEAQEDKRTEDSWLMVSTDECIPFWPKAEKSDLMRIKIADTADITTPFNFTEVQCTLLPLKNKVRVFFCFRISISLYIFFLFTN